MMALVSILFCLVALLLYLGQLVLVTQVEDEPPSYVWPRLLFMLGVAIFVVRRPGKPSCVPRVTTLLYEIILTILICNLALTLVWDQVEKIVHLLLGLAATKVEAVTGWTIVCPGCKGIHSLQYAITLTLSIMLLSWVLCSFTTYSLFERTVRLSICQQPLQLSFCSKVQVRYIQPDTYITDCTVLEEIHAPRSTGKNPIIDPPSFEVVDNYN
uniref:G-protein coupled receptors family 3 profile domain-containing protein n=1 Tax=Graphocephala atropunctata TaxID=36148 RepID=A0A1B6MUQ6_9HEMI